MTTYAIDFDDGATNELTIHNTHYEAENLILILPAMGVRASYYNDFAKAISNDKLIISSLDLRGQGKSSIRAGKAVDWGYKEHIQDLNSVVNFIRIKFPKVGIFLFGHSLGGQMAALYSAKHPTKVKGLILIATCSVYYKGWKGFSRFKTLVGIRLIGLINSVVGYYPGDRLGFGGNEGKTEMKDWYKNGITGRYDIENDEIDYDKELSKTQSRILAITIADDNFAPYQATKNLLVKFNSNSLIDHISIEDGKGMNHFNWTKSPQLFKDSIDEWINKTSSKNENYGNL